MQKHPPIIMYGMKSLVTVSMETKRDMENLTVTARPIMEPDLCAKFQICTIYGL